jgi:hypothetical protein
MTTEKRKENTFQTKTPATRRTSKRREKLASTRDLAGYRKRKRNEHKNYILYTF